MSAGSGAAAREGYALPVVLAGTAALALVFAAAASASAALAVSARAAADGAGFAARAESAEARALFLTATRRALPQGLAADGASTGAGAPSRVGVRLDGTPVAGLGDAALAVELQDEAGLLNLDRSRPDTLLRLFARLGLSAGEAETLRDRLLDAVDGAERPRPRGAVVADYRARGLAPPPAGGFEGLAEVAGVLGWPQLMGGARARALSAWAAATRGPALFNVNTAPAPVLAMVLNLDDAAAARIVARREAPITSLAQLGLPPPGAGAPEPVRPSGRVRLTVEDRRLGLRYVSTLVPSEAASGPPWSAVSATVVHLPPAGVPSHAELLPQSIGPEAPG